jgi:hypothetical protein
MDSAVSADGTPMRLRIQPGQRLSKFLSNEKLPHAAHVITPTLNRTQPRTRTYPKGQKRGLMRKIRITELHSSA